MLSDPENNYERSFDGVDVGGLPAEVSTLKSRDGKESWSIAPITSSQGITNARNVVRKNKGPKRRAFKFCSSAFISSFLFFRRNLQRKSASGQTKKEGKL